MKSGKRNEGEGGQVAAHAALDKASVLAAVPEQRAQVLVVIAGGATGAAGRGEQP